MKLILTEKENEIIKNVAKNMSNESFENTEQTKNLVTELPQKFTDSLLDFKKNGSPTGYLLLNIPPFFNVLNTPDVNTNNVGKNTELAKIQAISMSVMGQMVGYEAEANGSLFQDIVPIKSMSDNQTSTGSSFELEIHTEQAFSKLRPDILCLACLRGDENAYTYILPVQFIIENLSKYEFELARQPLWKTGVDMSFKMNKSEFIEGDIRGPMPILQGTIDDPFLVFDQDLMFGTTDESKELLNKITKLYYKYRLKYNLKMGDIIFIDNNRAVHGRSPFLPKFDGYDRFLIRSFLVFDFERVRYACDKKEFVISSIYS